MNSRETRSALSRLSRYLSYLESMPFPPETISATAIAEGVGFGDVLVRKDLAAVSSGGKPKIGYETRHLIADLRRHLNCNRHAVLVGVGNLGRALLSHRGFGDFGLTIAAAFDADPTRIGTLCEGHVIHPMQNLPAVCRSLDRPVGVIAVPKAWAQTVCDQLVEAGVGAIWNFAPVHLQAPDSVIVHTEDIAASLAMLSKQLSVRAGDEPAVDRRSS